MKTLASSWEKSVSLYHEKLMISIVDENESLSYTYGDIESLSCKFISCMERISLKPFDRVLLIGEGHPFWIATFLALQKQKITVVAPDPTWSHEELLYTIERFKPRAVFLSQSVLEKNIEIPKNIYSLKLDEHLSFIQEGSFFETENTHEDVALIAFTTGSTGVPKGVMLTHQNIIHAATETMKRSQFKKETRILGVLPINHSYGFTLCTACWFAGSEYIMVKILRGDIVLKALSLKKPHFLFSVPRLFQFLIEEIEKKIEQKGKAVQFVFALLIKICRFFKSFKIPLYNILLKSIHKPLGGNLKYVAMGGAPSSLSVLKKWEQLGFEPLQGYGLTETAPLITMTNPGLNALGSVGKPLLDVEVYIHEKDSEGQGEIHVKGPIVMKGYYADQEATAQAFENGYFKTGDLGKFDEKGCLWITGRAKEMIVLPTGKKTTPFEIEQAYRSILGITDLAALGMLNKEKTGDDIHLAIVLSPSTESSFIRQEIGRLSKTLPPYLQVHKIHFINEIPRASIKVRYEKLRQNILELEKEEPIYENKGKNVSEENDPILNILYRFSKQKIKITQDSLLQMDLGFDSLTMAEIAVQIEASCGVSIFLSLNKISSVKDLYQTIEERRGQIQIPPQTKNQFNLKFHNSFLRKTFVIIFLFKCWLISKITWNLKVYGKEKIPQKGAFLLCPNHETNLDTLWVALSLPLRTQIQATYFAKSELFTHFFTRLLAHTMGAIPVDRLGDITSAMNTANFILENHLPLLIHPEGTRSEDGSLGVFRKGAAQLSLQTKVPLIPVRIIGAFDIFPRGQSLPSVLNLKKIKRHPLMIIFGDPLYPQENENIEDLTLRLRNAVDSLKKPS